MKMLDYQPEGLSGQEAERRILEYGENRLEGKRKTGPLKIFMGQFKDLMVIILLISTVLSMLMGETVEAIAIIAIVLLNALMGFLQEYRTERTLDALKNMAAPTATLLRDRKPVQLPASEVVPGDILLLKAGDRIAADGIVVDCSALACDESMITGESVAAEKEKAQIPFVEQPDSHALVYMGTTVTKGHGRVFVTRTGMNSEMGKIAGMLDEIEEDMTPLQQKLDQLGKYIAVGCLLICAVVSLTGILRGEAVFDMIVTGISLAVAAVPEGLPAIVTIALALAVNRILKRNALVRKLHAVETLGCASVICSDKTGTLTENRMTVKELSLEGEQIQVTGSGYEKHGDFLREGGGLTEFSSAATLLMEIAANCNNAMFLNRESREPGKLFLSHGGPSVWEVSGEPTEAALLVLAAKGGVFAGGQERVREFPFDSTRKMMSVLVTRGNGYRLLAKGAPDVLLKRCSSVLTRQGVQPLTAAWRQKILAANDQMAQRALRVLSFAYRDLEQTSSNPEENLIFVGMAGMLDPPRKEAAQAVQKCRRAGIRPVMITGDHKLTACAIAKELGILRGQEKVLTGEELDRLSQEELAGQIGQISVFARVNPGHKLRIVKALKQRGEIVAMTGDGVNDAPAIKEANIGVAMGINGTDVTKEAASIILLDDNFATLVAAVEEGRVIYQNIRRFIRYLLSCNTGEVVTMFAGMLMGMPVVLLPIQILLVNLVTDGLPAIALGFEPATKDIMGQKPRGAQESIFAHGLLTTILFRGCLIGLTTLAVYSTFFRLYGDLSVARTGALMTLIFTQLIHVFECKSETRSLLGINPFSNVKLILAVLISGGVAFATLYHPALRFVFQTTALGWEQLQLIAMFCLAGPLLWAVVLHIGSGKKTQRP